MEFQDKVLKCKECGKEFTWTAGEQQFFADKGFNNKPTRCKDCRKLNRQKVEAEYFKIVCSNCKQVGEALFKPSDPSAEIFCKKCFEEKFLSPANV
jgi:RecJ-like exonuclease